MVESDTKSYAAIVRHEIRHESTSWIAFSLLLAWMFGLYWSDLLVSSPSTPALDFLDMRAWWLGTEAVVLAGLRLFASPAIKHASILTVLGGTLLFAGTLMILFGPSGETSLPVALVGIFFTGIGSAVLLLWSGVDFARRGSRALLVDVALALLVASALDTVLALLPHEARSLFVVLLPVASVSFLMLAQKKAPLPSSLGSVPTAHKAPQLSIVRMVALPLVVGLAYGLLQRLTRDAYVAGPVETNVVTILSFLASAIVIALAALFLTSRKLVQLVCFAAIPLIGVAFVMLPLFSNSRDAVQAVCIVGFNSFYFMVWALWAESHEGEPAPIRSFMLGLFVLVASESLGSLLGAPVALAAQESTSTLAIVSLVTVYVLLMAGIFAFNRSAWVDQDDPLPADNEASPSASSNSEQPKSAETPLWQKKAEDAGLSARETEVFELLARGRNRDYISKNLFISSNTTRTHMKSIYRKLDVHSHQELIDLLEPLQEEKEGLPETGQPNELSQ